MRPNSRRASQLNNPNPDRPLNIADFTGRGSQASNPVNSVTGKEAFAGEPPSETIHKSQALPPFPVMLEWLRYYYEQTGRWELPSTSAFPPEFTANSPATLQYNPAIPAGNQPGLSRTSVSRSEAGQAAGDTGQRTSGFNYSGSAYYQVAGLAIEQYATHSIPPAARQGCRAALALVLAWCHHPLFNGMSGRAGRWTTLPLNRCGLELGMRAASFQQYITELQTCGLLRLARLDDPAEFEPFEYDRLRQDVKELTGCLDWSPRSIQNKNTVYLLNFSLAGLPALPLFNPGSTSEPVRPLIMKHPEGPDHTTGRTLEAQLALPAHFPEVSHETCSSRKITEKEIIENKNHDHEAAAKYDFLTRVARFAGLEREDGLETLDPREALKFARNSRLELKTAQDIYQRVHRLWQHKAAEVVNPIGLFHWNLARCSGHSTDGTTSPGPVRVGSHSPIKPDNSPRPNSPLYNSGERGSVPTAGQAGDKVIAHRMAGWKKYTGHPAAAAPDLQAYHYPDQTLQASPEALRRPETGYEQDRAVRAANDLARLWQTVLEYDLPGRFRLGAVQVNLLAAARLEILPGYSEPLDRPAQDLMVQAAGRALRLVVRFRGALELLQLEAATRSTVTIALRQRLGRALTVAFELAGSSQPSNDIIED